jgi:hypothetical protein
VPDPFTEPVELPWEHKDRDGYWMGVNESQRPWAAARVGGGDACADLTAEACRAMARALMAAADAAEKGQFIMTKCRFCTAAAVGVCCSSHNESLCHRCYRGTHFVEVCVKGCTSCEAEGLPVVMRRAGKATS